MAADTPTPAQIAARFKAACVAVQAIRGRHDGCECTSDPSCCVCEDIARAALSAAGLAVRAEVEKEAVR